MNYEPLPTDEAIDFAWLNMTGDEYAAQQLLESTIEAGFSASPLTQE